MKRTLSGEKTENTNTSERDDLAASGSTYIVPERPGPKPRRVTLRFEVAEKGEKNDEDAASRPARSMRPTVDNEEKEFGEEDTIRYNCLTEPSAGTLLSVERNYKSERTVWGKNRRVNLTFRNNTSYDVKTLREAMDYWEKACGVKFIQIEKDDHTEAFFAFAHATEQQENMLSAKGVVAMAFFPGDGNPRVVTLFKVFETQQNKVAVLAHELGHMLGFRHEHIWTHLTSESIGNAQALTSYDPDSIMHYQKLWDDQKDGRITKMSHLDIIGSQVIYGPPADQIRDIMEIEQ